MVLSSIDWMNGLMNVFFSYWMNEWFNEKKFNYWMNDFALNFYLQVDALDLGNWEWCEVVGGWGHKSFHLHVVGPV